MPYSIRRGYRDCTGFAVVKDEDGDLMGCHDTRAAAQDQITALNISEAEKALLPGAKATKASDEEIAARYSDFQDAVNMSASDIEAWGETECADEASERPQEVRSRVIRLLRTPREDWGDAEHEAAGRVISFISRMRGMEQGEASGDCPSDRDISLMNWGYDPTKSTRPRTSSQRDLFTTHETPMSDLGAEHTEGDTLVYPGAEIKDLSDKGVFGGYLVRFGEAESPDLEGDFFTKETDFWLPGGEGETFALYGHGMDPELGRRRITPKKARLVVKDAGVWMEAQMQARNEYEEMIMQLAKEGKLGLSSGTAAHLVEAEPGEGATHIRTWPLGLDASLTPQPAEPRTLITPLKQLSIPALKSIGAGTDPHWKDLDSTLDAILSGPLAGPASGAAEAAERRAWKDLDDTLTNLTKSL